MPLEIPSGLSLTLLQLSILRQSLGELYSNEFSESVYSKRLCSASTVLSFLSFSPNSHLSYNELHRIMSRFQLPTFLLFATFFLLILRVTTVTAAPFDNARRASFTLQNGKDAIALNNKFATLTASSSCISGEVACVGGDFAQCVDGKFVTTSCGATLVCKALPLVNSAGTSVTCDTEGVCLACLLISVVCRLMRSVSPHS